MRLFFSKRGVSAGVAALTAIGGVGAVSVGGLTTAGCKNGRFSNMISRSDQIDLGRKYAREVDREEPVIESGPVNARMQRIAARIFPQARRDFEAPYSIKVIDKKEINAFALPGGPIYFYKGLIDLADSDDEIAAVLGHESAHVTQQHVAKQISDAQGKGLLASILTQGKSDVVQSLAGLGLGVYQLKFSRGDEAQADEVGFEYLTRAGYDPDAMASLFKKMAAKSGKGGPEWLSSHPLTTKRIEAAEKRAAEYKARRNR